MWTVEIAIKAKDSRSGRKNSKCAHSLRNGDHIEVLYLRLPPKKKKEHADKYSVDQERTLLRITALYPRYNRLHSDDASNHSSEITDLIVIMQVRVI